MGFQEAVRTCFRKYVTFSGRAARSEYWWFMLFLFLGGVITGIVDGVFFDAASVETGPGEIRAESNGPIGTLFSIATLLPSLAAGWRRMHDTGRSGFFLIYPLIVMVGVFTFAGFFAGFEPLLAGDIGALLGGAGALIVGLSLIVLILSPLLVIWWLTRPSQPGTNEYGPNPHEVTS